MTYTLFPVQTKKALEQRKIIYRYRNDNYWLSNFWPCAVVLPAERDLPAMTFTSVENAYMAWKTINQQVREQIQKMEPGDAKKETHKPEFAHRSPYTNDMRVEIMEKLIEQKFSMCNPDLLQKLLETEDALLIEGNLHHDDFFGFDLEKGYGHNYLGRIQMKVRQMRQAEMA